MLAAACCHPPPVSLLQQQSVLVPPHTGYWLSLHVAGDLEILLQAEYSLIV